MMGVMTGTEALSQREGRSVAADLETEGKAVIDHWRPGAFAEINNSALPTAGETIPLTKSASNIGEA